MNTGRSDDELTSPSVEYGGHLLYSRIHPKNRGSTPLQCPGCHAKAVASILGVTFTGRHIVSIDDFTREEILTVLHLARDLETNPRPDLFNAKLMGTLFFEPSTRTRLSFEAAMSKFGGKVIGFSDASSSSSRKGETLSDTIRMVEQYSDVIVLRHPQDGAARLAGEFSRVPVINGGDGSNQHPSQTFLDLYTIEKLFAGRMDSDGTPLRVCFAGDLKYGRTVHSLLCALSNFNVEMITVAPKGLEMPTNFLDVASKAGIKVTHLQTLDEAVAQSDVLYMTRLQQERFPDPVEFDHVKATYRMTAKQLKKANPELRILHPLPRVNEIATDVDDTPHAAYFAQAGNGIPIRQAMLALVLGVINR